MTAARYSDSDDLTLRTTMIGLSFTPSFVCLFGWLVDCLSVRLFFVWQCLAVCYGLIRVLWFSDFFCVITLYSYVVVAHDDMYLLSF